MPGGFALAAALTLCRANSSSAYSRISRSRQSSRTQFSRPYAGVSKKNSDHRQPLGMSMGRGTSKPRHQCWIPALLSGELSLSLQHRINVVDTRDVADTLVGALRGEAYGDPIAVIGHDTSVNDLFLFWSAIWAAPIVRAGPYRPLSGCCPRCGPNLPGGSSANRHRCLRSIPMLLCEQEWLQTDPAWMRLTGERRSLATTVRDTIAWYRSIGYCSRLKCARIPKSPQAFHELFVFRSRQGREQSAVFMMCCAGQPMSHATRVVDTAVSVHHLSEPVDVAERPLFSAGIFVRGCRSVDAVRAAASVGTNVSASACVSLPRDPPAALSRSDHRRRD